MALLLFSVSPRCVSDRSGLATILPPHRQLARLYTELAPVDSS